MQVTEILTDHTLMALDLQGAEDYPIRFYLTHHKQFDWQHPLALAPRPGVQRHHQRHHGVLRGERALHPHRRPAS